MLPILFESSWLTIFSYPLLMGLSWGIGFNTISSLLYKNEKSLKGFFGLFWGAFIFAWLGAKAFFLLFSSGENLELYANNSSFWLGGGFVFYGGAIFGLAFVLLYSKVLKYFNFNNIHFLLPGLSLGHAIGRIGCFLAGCCYGTASNLPWAVHLHSSTRHPVQLYEALSLFLLTYILKKQINFKHEKLKIVSTYFISYGIIRFCLEFLRGDKIRGVHALTLSTSQYISISFVFAFILLILIKRIQHK